MPDREYLLIRGRLDRADDFTPRRCASTSFVQHWPHAEHSDIFVDTVSHEGDVVRSMAALVEREQVCAPGGATWRVRAYVPLDEPATGVQLRRGTRVLWETRIPDAPEVHAALEARPSRGSRPKRATGRGRPQKPKAEDDATPGFPGGGPAVLSIEMSDPAEPDLAHVTIVHRWSERGFRTVYIGPPARTIEIPADRLPGGRECRLIVIYSNGFRSATAATEPFELEPIGPVIRITSPEAGARIPEGTPVALEGVVEDPEQPSGPLSKERLAWSVDGNDAGTGPLTSIDPLERGQYTIKLSYRGYDDHPTVRDGDSEAPASSSATVRITVAEADAVPANAWPDPDPFAEL